MMRVLKSFVRSTDGAVTVDWVLITAGVVSLAVASIGALNDGTENVASDTGTYIAARNPATF